MLAVGLDATVLSVALPTLAVSLHASATDLQWFVSSYTLALAVGLLPGGLLGDRFGRKKVMMITLAVFGLELAGLRVLPRAPESSSRRRTALGLSAGFMIPLVLSIITVMFADDGADQGGGNLGGGQLPGPADRPDRWAAGCCRTTGGAGCS